ncbi:MAG: metallophosphoesterase family protein [bacterium]|nr:metallophosphoesterase family protein [bacterium]
MQISKFALSLLAAIFLFHGYNSAADIANQEHPKSSISSKGIIKPDSFRNIILTWQDDPKTSQAVTWRTEVRIRQAMAEIAIADPSPDFGNSSQQFIAKSSTLETGQGLSYYHTVNFTNLRPDTLYAYRVGNAKVWSEWFQFRTAGEKRKAFSFIYLGDAQHDIYSLWSRAIRAAILEAPKARFMIHTGDMVDRRNSDSEWKEWFEAGGWILATIPSIPVTGNHEYKKRGLGGPSLSKYWKPQFALPELGREDLDETVYYVDFQGVRVVALNSNLKIKDQAKWMEKLLANNPNSWTIIAFHHPIYSAAKGRNNKKLIKHWKPVFEKYRVDLVIQGHDHVYARGRGFCSEVGACQEPIYITSVSGPDMFGDI